MKMTTGEERIMDRISKAEERASRAEERAERCEALRMERVEREPIEIVSLKKEPNCRCR
jgi:hypothetical protein